MKLIVKLFFFTILITSHCLSQNQVRWDFSFNEQDQTLILTATMDEGWHLYSQHNDENAGPIPTAFHFKKNKLVKLIGETTEPQAKKEYDSNFESDLLYFDDRVVFQQKVKVKKETMIEGVVTYMACDSTRCLPPQDVPFVINVK